MGLPDMDVNQKQDLIKLELLESLSRSQRALARMMENMAEFTDYSPQMAKHLIEHIEVISKYQRILTTKLTGITFTSRKLGKPGKPWLHHSLIRSGRFPKKR